MQVIERVRVGAAPVGQTGEAAEVDDSLAIGRTCERGLSAEWLAEEVTASTQRKTIRLTIEHALPAPWVAEPVTMNLTPLRGQFHYAAFALICLTNSNSIGLT